MPGKMIARILLGIYRVLLLAYPRRFRDEFAEEMLFVFERSLERAGQRGGWTVLEAGIRELLQTPLVLLRLHQRDIRRKLTGRSAIELLSPSGHTRRNLDGRTSWLGALLETSPFLIFGAVLVAVTYLPISWPQSGRWGEISSLGTVVLWVSLPVICLGLILGAPRWIFPFLGMTLGYAFIVAQRDHLSGYLALSLCSYAALAIAAGKLDSNRSLPQPLCHIGRELTGDWTRMSLAVYGVMPLLVQIAFDDTRFNDRTPFLAVSVCSMILGAVLYSRGRRVSWQIASLLAGITFSFLAVLLEQAYFHGGISDWLAVQDSWLVDFYWLLQYWAGMAALVSAPALTVLVRRVNQGEGCT